MQLLVLYDVSNQASPSFKMQKNTNFVVRNAIAIVLWLC